MNPTQPNDLTTTDVAVSGAPRFREAYQRLLQEIDAVADGDLAIINLDIPIVVTTILGSLPEIRALRPRIVEELPKFDLVQFDKLEAYALALGHAHSLFMATSAPVGSVEPLAEAGAILRETLYSDASALVKRGLIDGQRLKDLKGVNGYRNLAFDLLALSAVMRDSWSVVSGKTAVQPAELDEAEALADKLLTAVGLRDQAPTGTAATAQNRQRAFTLFTNAYDQTRRAITYLRWAEDDVDSIAPSLYAGRGTGRRRPADEPDSSTPPSTTPTIPPPPFTPSPTPGGTTSGPAAQNAGLPAAPSPAPAAQGTPGLPGNSPFDH